jgi:hypothetical protein
MARLEALRALKFSRLESFRDIRSKQLEPSFKKNKT